MRIIWNHCVSVLHFLSGFLYRYPTLPVAELQRHQAPVNALAWAPHSSCHICTAGDDSQACALHLLACIVAGCTLCLAPGLFIDHCCCLISIHVTMSPQALIWDLTSMGSGGPQTVDTSLDPILAYSAGEEINQLQWCTGQPDWVGICFGSKTQILRV